MGNPTAQSQLGALGVATRTQGGLDWELLQVCRDTYNYSNTQYEHSINEGQEAIDFFHNRQWTQDQLDTLEERGQPAETYNVVKMLCNAILGYMDTVVSDINIEPRHMNSAATALLLNDTVSFTLDENDFERSSKRMKLDGLLTGLMVAYENVKETGATDQFGRKLYRIEISHIPSWQVRLDPLSILDDYSDARFIHYFKWLPEEKLIKLYGEKTVAEMTEYYNFLDGDKQADFDRRQTMGRFNGRYRQWDNYLTVHSVVEHKGKVWSCVWYDETLLEKKEITTKNVRFPYRVTKMSDSDRAEYYGPMREVTESQKAINQALVQIQQLVNTSKAFVEDNAVDDLDQFRELFSRVNAVIPVSDLQGIKIEDMSRDVLNQYQIIDQALTRIKAVLGINDAFLGNTFASDSGRKVQLNQASSASQLTPVVDKVNYFYKMVGTDIIGLVQQYYRGNQVLRVADPINGAHYAELNKPLEMPTDKVNPMTGEPVMTPVFAEDIDPETGEPLEDENGNIIVTPLNDPDTDIEFSEVDVKVVASRAQNAEERNQLLLETLLNGPAGQALMQMAPAKYMRILAMQTSEFGTKHSIEITKLLAELAMEIEQGQVDPRLAMFGGDAQAIIGGAMGGNNGAGGAPTRAGSMQAQPASDGPQSPSLQIPNKFGGE